MIRQQWMILLCAVAVTFSCAAKSDEYWGKPLGGGQQPASFYVRHNDFTRATRKVERGQAVEDDIQVLLVGIHSDKIPASDKYQAIDACIALIDTASEPIAQKALELCFIVSFNFFRIVSEACTDKVFGTLLKHAGNSNDALAADAFKYLMPELCNSTVRKYNMQVLKRFEQLGCKDGVERALKGLAVAAHSARSPYIRLGALDALAGCHQPFSMTIVGSLLGGFSRDYPTKLHRTCIKKTRDVLEKRLEQILGTIRFHLEGDDEQKKNEAFALLSTIVDFRPSEHVLNEVRLINAEFTSVATRYDVDTIYALADLAGGRHSADSDQQRQALDILCKKVNEHMNDYEYFEALRSLSFIAKSGRAASSHKRKALSLLCEEARISYDISILKLLSDVLFSSEVTTQIEKEIVLFFISILSEKVREQTSGNFVHEVLLRATEQESLSTQLRQQIRACLKFHDGA